MTYANDVQTKKTDPTQPVRGKNQVQNNAGGFVFQVDDWSRLDRFLILGHEGGTYYASQRSLSLETVDCLDRCLAEDGNRTVDRIVEISQAGRAPKNDPAIFALAYVVSKNDETSKYALTKLKDVCRIGTHLFDFLNNCKTLGKGWGKGFRAAITEWYNRDPERLAVQVTKYAQRNGWSHRDVLRKVHPSVSSRAINNVFAYVTNKDKWLKRADAGPSDEFLAAVEEVRVAPETRQIELIQDYGLVREHLPTEALNSVKIWEALLENMPLTAMIRNLGKMSSIGLVKPLSAASNKVVAALGNTDALRHQRVHPITLLIALKQYNMGRGLRGSLTWNVDTNVVSALDSAFYAAFGLIQPTGKNHLLGVDVSGSMTAVCNGTPVLSCREAAAAMAMVAFRTEQNSHAFGFSHEFVNLGITRDDSLQDVLRKTSSLPMAGTNCALPMVYAREQGLEVDVFVVYTDNETWAGGGAAWGSNRSTGHVFQELEAYRQSSGRNAKMAVFGLAQTDFTIADPSDAGQMDFVGFDAAAPSLLADFARD